jgi:glycosyltransferase involved in cell wall biosynthesis
MRIVYVLLSPTFGMHQYIGDLAAQMVNKGHDVHVVTTIEACAQRDRYPAGAIFHTPVCQRSTGFKFEGLDGRGLWRVRQCIVALRPQLVHFGGVHLWNPLLMQALRRAGLPVVHTLHDLDPHPDVAYGSLIRLWNRAVVTWADGIVVHGMSYRRRLLAAGRPPETVLATPLLHSFLSAAEHEQLVAQPPEPAFEPWMLFFGRFERYKGLDVLLTAQQIIARYEQYPGVVLAGSGDLIALWPSVLPPGVTVHNRRIESAEGSRLFQHCSVVVLPYTGATQSALPATAYAFGKPVIVTSSGALSEVVQPGVSGWVVPAGDANALVRCVVKTFANLDRLVAAGTAGRRWYEQQRNDQQSELVQFYASVTVAAN